MGKEVFYMKKTINVKYIAKIGILSAIAAVLMLFELPLWFAPPFYKLDFSEIPILIGSFALGPLAGVIMELLKNLINLLLDGTTTAFVGEFANFVTGCAFVLPSALIYKYHKSLRTAVLGMLAGTASLIFVGALMNYFILIPTFSKLYELPLEVIVAMGTKVNASITDLKTLVVFAVMPFNLLKAVACSVVTLLLYKRVSKILHI
ncbi:MAG: ECF transporter S component [Clostridia bacterium]|nr:ECF transporter S component [Clostridia bacterium]